MARNEWDDTLGSVLTGMAQGYSTAMTKKNALNDEMAKTLMLEKLKNAINPPEYKPRTMQEALNFESAKAGIVKPKEAQQEQKTALQIQDLQNKQVDAANQKSLQSQGIIDTANDTLNTIGEVKKGAKYFGATGAVPTLNPWGFDRIKWEANVNKLLSGKVIDLITEMKKASKTGATGFGQLSDAEGKILREASTALNKRMSSQDALDILNTMEDKFKKIVNPVNTDNVNTNTNTTITNQTLTPDIARQILSIAGGDKNKARIIAKQKGYTF